MSTTTSSLEVRFMRVLGHVVERPKAFSPWPDPEESVGRLYRSLGRHQCWEIRGKARDAYLRLASDIKGHLERHGDVVSATVIWAAYMIGKSKQCASPTVFFCSKDSNARKMVRNEIENSGLLATHPGFRTGDCTRPPHLDHVRQLAIGDQIIPQRGSGFSNAACRNPMGCQIQVRQDGPRSSSTPATIGAILRLGEELYFTTAAHAFDELDGDLVDYDGPADAEFEWDFDDEYGDDASAEYEQVTAYAGPRPESLQTRQSSIKPQAEQSFFHSKNVRLSSVGSQNSHLDYCLVGFKRGESSLVHERVSSSKVCEYHTSLPRGVASGSPQEGDVIAYTGSNGACHGTLSGVPSFMTLAGGQVTQELWTVHLDGMLENGDCGSMVISASTGDLEGHIIAGDPATGSALIVPAYQMLKDIQVRYDSNIHLFTMEHCSDLEQEMYGAVAMHDDRSGDGSSNATVGESTSCETADAWAASITRRFRRMLSERRMHALRAMKRQAYSARPNDLSGLEDRARKETPQRPSPALAFPDNVFLKHLFHEPECPTAPKHLRFRKHLMSFSNLPCMWENSFLLDVVLADLPLDQIYGEAQVKATTLQAVASLLGKDSKPAWDYQDCVIRALMTWFKQSFFQWINNPHCSVCHMPTVARGLVQPTVEEETYSATRVEMFQCTNNVRRSTATLAKDCHR
ncbi:unnamed protein product [Zymoseptoria tritici ST99CH_1A5]|uniref:Uncharacterized protein n=1 Tax=Zymoseptoria tritici ST99CH_1A5 TaxID=1276529 RepID=A0A1Y6LMW1_ZYMTR|nr:unnamed protein product [Zymoseptoria tritici ST99CH_3D1]SMY25736.1 unnamed protein product [Zymoseptoria tritici ST99CH_1A5]